VIDYDGRKLFKRERRELPIFVPVKEYHPESRLIERKEPGAVIHYEHKMETVQP
jgi:hypothetical protein